MVTEFGHILLRLAQWLAVLLHLNARAKVEHLHPTGRWSLTTIISEEDTGHPDGSISDIRVWHVNSYMNTNKLDLFVLIIQRISDWIIITNEYLQFSKTVLECNESTLITTKVNICCQHLLSVQAAAVWTAAWAFLAEQ